MPGLLQHIIDEGPNVYARYSTRKFVYLDLKYWIILRDGKKSNDAVILQLTDKIEQLHHSGKCIFPISDIIYYEIMKQGDNIQRAASIALVDKYSEGLAMANALHQFQIYFGYWMRNQLSITNLTEPLKSVWTAINLVIAFPGFDQQAKNLREGLQKSFFEFASNIPLSVIHNETTVPFTPYKGKDDVDGLNEGKEKYKDQNKSFKEMFLSELEGFIQELKGPVRDELVKLFVEKMKRQPTVQEMADINPNDYCKLIIQLFKDEKLTNQLPLLKIFPSLFALTRWNKDRIYKDGNDTADVLHAVHALPNCHYFLTEKELKSMIVQLKLDKLFDCVVESDPKKALDILNNI